MKFWIGASSNLANMAAIWAELIIDKIKYGIHVFIVPIRDLKTHDLFPGVLIGIYYVIQVIVDLKMV
jgi:acyl-CoA oxidase